MNEDTSGLTQSDLKALGLSEYLIREICKDLPFTRMNSGAKNYTHSNLRESIVKKLSQLKIKPTTREHLQIVLNLLENKSKVIEVDFLKNLTSEQRINFLKNYREDLRAKGETILQDIDKLLEKAKKLI